MVTMADLSTEKFFPGSAGSAQHREYITSPSAAASVTVPMVLAVTFKLPTFWLGSDKTLEYYCHWPKVLSCACFTGHLYFGQNHKSSGWSSGGRPGMLDHGLSCKVPLASKAFVDSIDLGDHKPSDLTDFMMSLHKGERPDFCSICLQVSVAASHSAGTFCLPL